jgi:hypothetical protein
MTHNFASNETADVDELFDLMAPWARAGVAAAGRIG